MVRAAASASIENPSGQLSDPPTGDIRVVERTFVKATCPSAPVGAS
jgi:hypothetical protein